MSRHVPKSAKKRARAAERKKRERALALVRGPGVRATAAPPPPKMTTAEKAADERAANAVLRRTKGYA